VAATDQVRGIQDDANRVYLDLKAYFEASTNYWRLGCCFDTMTDCLRILGPATDRDLLGLALTKYHSTSGAWYDDFAWWAIASAKAYDPAFAPVFGDQAGSFTDIAQECWATLDQGMNDGVHKGASQVYENRDNESCFTNPPPVPAYWVTPRFDGGRGSGLHGVWQKDIFANERVPPNWTGPAEFAPNPSIPSDATTLGPYQNTVVNALYLLAAVRFEQARVTNPGIPSTTQQALDEYGFLRTWMGYNQAQPVPPGETLLNQEFNDGTAVVRERVSTYAMHNGSYPPVKNWDPRTSWGGDQGLMINALAGYYQIRPDSVIPPLLRALLLGYARHEVGEDGKPEPYFPIKRNKLESWDKEDYASGAGVFMRAVLQAAGISGGPVEAVVKGPEFQAFLQKAVAWARTAAPDDLFSSLNVLATLLAGIELLQPSGVLPGDGGSMSTEPREIATNPIHLDPLPDVFDSEGLEIVRPLELLQQSGVNDLSRLVGLLQPDPGAVQDAPSGAIQDPAGTAIGAGKGGFAGARGASAAIYEKFPDLEPIPSIQPRSAIFNSSTGAGRRVLHTFSPTLSGSPQSSQDRRQALEDLANAYANAVEAFRDSAAALGEDGALLNLVPVSASIFAHAFKDPAYDHLHPSYTICAIALALDWSRGSGLVPDSLKIHFYMPGTTDNPVYEAAKGVIKSLAGTT
jgi:hypothetical protein